MSARQPDTGLTSAELVKATGASYRQIDYWTTTGLLLPRGATSPGMGYPRNYDPEQLDRARAIVALLAGGVGLEAVRTHIDHLIRHGGYQAGPVTVTYTPEHTS